MTDEAGVSDLRAFVGSLELVISSLVVTHHDKAQLASRLVEVAHLIHANPGGAPTRPGHAHQADYDTVMSFAQLAQQSLESEYRRAEHRAPPGKPGKGARGRGK